MKYRFRAMAILIEKPVDVAKDHFLMRIDIGSARSRPGQFVNIRVGNTHDPLLRRPFSIHDSNGSVVDIVVRVVGKGTSLLREGAMPGNIDIIGPLGRGFTLLESGSALLVGGGVGNAPLYFLARRLRERGVKVTCVYGARSLDCVFLRERYESAADRIRFITDDGSCGDRGFSTDAAKELAAEGGFDAIYACGPAAMMARTVEIFRDAPCLIEVSLENYFGCGVGLCSGCAVETVSGNKRACVDGPVLDGRAVLWQNIYEDTGALSCAP